MYNNNSEKSSLSSSRGGRGYDHSYNTRGGGTRGGRGYASRGGRGGGTRGGRGSYHSHHHHSNSYYHHPSSNNRSHYQNDPYNNNNNNHHQNNNYHNTFDNTAHGEEENYFAQLQQDSINQPYYAQNRGSPSSDYNYEMAQQYEELPQQQFQPPPVQQTVPQQTQPTLVVHQQQPSSQFTNSYGHISNSIKFTSQPIHSIDYIQNDPANSNMMNSQQVPPHNYYSTYPQQPLSSEHGPIPSTSNYYHPPPPPSAIQGVPQHMGYQTSYYSKGIRLPQSQRDLLSDCSTLSSTSSFISQDQHSIDSHSSFSQERQQIQAVRITGIPNQLSIPQFLSLLKSNVPILNGNIKNEHLVKPISNPKFPDSYYIFLNINGVDGFEAIKNHLNNSSSSSIYGSTISASLKFN
ncbi:hypothetical protein C9374_011137 [Naegleria lovaniensis]|uniref:Uncharacterized protein n=1 Tax=Naegleria lovaniensis TaxID=51637 RepID=A0AA88KDE4_NAELO|nr:uncharacterized protein C9374_011137 [Naegleria lovaniensis]KAG2374058.1 hypothetical protein C9374_011137 [Naegleria lovaniensis]